MKNLPKVENPELVILLLEETLPSCKIFGSDIVIDNEQESNVKISQLGGSDVLIAQHGTQVQR